jgi:hypothetical protein
VAYALLFGLAALHKLRSPARFKQVLGSYAILPAAGLAPASIIIPLFELCLAVCLLVPRLQPTGALLASALLCLYAGVIAVTLLRGRVLRDCGCSFGATAQAPSAALALRNLLLALIPLQVLLPPTARALGLYDLVVGLFIIGAASLFYATTNTLIQQQHYSRSLHL